VYAGETTADLIRRSQQAIESVEKELTPPRTYFNNYSDVKSLTVQSFQDHGFNG